MLVPRCDTLTIVLAVGASGELNKDRDILLKIFVSFIRIYQLSLVPYWVCEISFTDLILVELRKIAVSLIIPTINFISVFINVLLLSYLVRLRSFELFFSLFSFFLSLTKV